MSNLNPFSDDAESTSFERGMPVNQAAKNVSQAAQAQAKQMIQDANKQLLDQMYGPSTPPTGEDPGTDETNVQHSDASNASTRQAASHAAASKTANVNPNQTPEEQAKMEKVRQELFGNYKAKFQAAPNGAQPLNTNLEMDIEKARKEREQKEAQRKQEEEEEEQRKKEEEEAKRQELDTPAGKKTGFQMGKKQQEPMALRLAKTKTESNRGTTG